MKCLTKWLKILLLIFFLPNIVFSQTITLQELIDSSNLYYRLTNQKKLIDQTSRLLSENIDKSLLPQININAQATYQSDVTQVNIPISTIKIDPMSKDQYKLVADVSQLIYDGGLSKQQKTITTLNAATEKQKIEIEVYKLKEKVTQIYLSVLFIDEQLKQTELIKADVENGIKKVQALVSNGVAYKSNLNTLKAQQLQIVQKQIELNATRKGLIDVLRVLTQQNITYSTQLQAPKIAELKQEIIRPELTLIQNQQKLNAQQTQLVKAKTLPKASLFVQGGYGRPGLNMLKNSFEPFAIGGVKFNWNLGFLYTEKREKQIINLNNANLEIQKENLINSITAQEKQLLAEINKLNELIVTDNEIIQLRTAIKNTANAQLENGVITSNDYLREINAEDQARQLLITHKIQLLQANINLQLLRGQF